jgi:tetratricopeptide (TPR) repeat protein
MLSQRLLNAEVPFEAAHVMEKGFKDGLVEKTERNLRLLGQAWTMAQEMDKAIETWGEASEYAEDGQIYYRLAQALASEDKHADAVKAYQSALDKGDLKKPYDVSFWMGISLMQLSRWDKAVDAFKDASNDKKKAKQCRQYIRYVRGEKRRQAELRKMDMELS